MSKNILESKNLISSLLENSYDGIYITDKDGFILYVNNTYEKLTGNERSTCIGKHISDPSCFINADLSVIKNAVKEHRSTTIKGILHSGKDIIMTVSPIFDDNDTLAAVIVNIHDISHIASLERSNALSKNVISHYNHDIYDFSMMQDIVCVSPKTLRSFELAAKVAGTDSSVLLTGETGTGKDVLAKFIHYNSPRKKGNYIKINCGAIPENLLASELFGYVKGAFTGADPKGKPGIFEMADKGTLFLDEIGELPLSLQASLLRVLQDGEITRLGSTEPQKVNVRIIAATNKDLSLMVNEKIFRDDLFYRLNVISIHMDPLDERIEDIPHLVKLFINKLNEKYNCDKHADDSFATALMSMHWPGNIRELSNFVERNFILSEGNSILLEEANKIKDNASNIYCDDENSGFNMEKAVQSVEADLIKSALKISKNTNEASKLLGISQPTFSRKYNKYKKMGLICEVTPKS